MAVDSSTEDSENYVRDAPPPMPPKWIGFLQESAEKMMKRQPAANALSQSQPGQADDLIKWLIRAIQAAPQNPSRLTFLNNLLEWGRKPGTNLDMPDTDTVKELQEHFVVKTKPDTIKTEGAVPGAG